MKEKIFINARIIDPSQSMDEKGSLILNDKGKVKAIGKNVKKTEEDLKKIFPKESWNKLHLQIIFWGREYCMAKTCYGTECKICKSCYPKRKKPFVHKRP